MALVTVSAPAAPHFVRYYLQLGPFFMFSMDVSKSWRASATIFLLAWGAIRFGLHSPCIFHEGGGRG